MKDEDNKTLLYDCTARIWTLLADRIYCLSVKLKPHGQNGHTEEDEYCSIIP